MTAGPVRPDASGRTDAADGRGLAAAFTNRSGVVATFDDHAGAGTVRDGTTDEVWPFHCTRLADGSRTIRSGTRVDFRVDLGPVGLEAVDVTVRL